MSLLLLLDGPASGSAALVEDADALSGAVAILAQGSAALAEADDAVTALAGVIVTGTAALAEAADSLAAAGAVLVSASTAAAEDPDTLSADGTVTQAGITADAALVENGDLLYADAENPTQHGGPAYWPRPIPVVHGPRRVAKPPAYARARLVEQDDGVDAIGSVSWPLRARRIRDEEWLLKRAA